MPQLLSESSVKAYRDSGFLRVEQVLNAEELHELRIAVDEVMLMQPQHSIQTSSSRDIYYRVLNQRVNTWRDHGSMAKYTLHTRFAQMARQLTGALKVRLFCDHALLKMPGDSKPTPWHQDFPYWPMEDINGPAWSGPLSMWIALDDVDENNGCMMFVPESHTIGKLKGINLTDPEDIFDYTQNVGIREKRPVIVRLKAGDCTFHNALTFHYAHANVTDRPRRALAIIYIPDGTVYNGKAHVVTDGQGLAVGSPLSGALFPLLA